MNPPSLKDLGISFTVSVPDANGAAEYLINVEDVLLLEKDLCACHAKLLNVSKTEYLGWLDEGQNVLCAGITLKGESCQNIVEGGSMVSASTWAKMQGSYCHLH